MRKTSLLLIALLALGARAGAQESPYAQEAPRSIAALSDQEVADLLDGAGMGFARAAELNGVPGPRHVLDMAAQLELSAPQRELIAEVFTRMQTRARRLGTAIVEQERELDLLFEHGQAAVPEVTRRTLELGRLYGELRGVHLAAHLETAALLEDRQIARYNELRGYATTAPDAAAAHEHH